MKGLRNESSVNSKLDLNEIFSYLSDTKMPMGDELKGLLKEGVGEFSRVSLKNTPTSHTVSPALLMYACHTILQRYFVTLQKHLGYFNDIFRLSQLHQCDQGM